MATTKITITLPDHQLAEIRKLVADKKSGSVSGFIRHAVDKLLQNDAEFLAMIEQALLETGGPITPKETAWARKVLTPKKRKAKPSKPRQVA